MRPLLDIANLPAPLSNAAIARGSTYHGKPCRRAGHTLRYTNGGSCVECQKAVSRERKPERTA